MSGLELYLNKVIEGDCLELLPGIPDQTIDMVLCDLPYGTTIIPWDKVINLEELWKHYERIIRPNGVVVLSAQGLFTGKVILSNPRWFRYKIVWVKSSATNFLNGKRQPLRKHEDICVFYNGQPTYHPQFHRGKIEIRKPDKDRMNTDSQGRIRPLPFVKKTRERYPYDVIFMEEDFLPDSVFFKSAASEGRIQHPTQKPVALARYLIRTYTNQGDIVLDNACGSGTFLVAAVMEHRRFVGIEKNEHSVHHREPVDYVRVSEERITEAVKWRKDEDSKLTLFDTDS